MKKSYVFLVVLFAFFLSACNKTEEAHAVAPAVVVAPVTESAKTMPLAARENNCTACHAIDKKVVGPSWMDIANKYKGDATAEARLITKVSKGGAGNWGTMPMPANDASGKKPEQMKELVRFILALAK
ncbi:MAG: c-type cytochrome [Nitrosomonadales bacterium]